MSNLLKEILDMVALPYKWLDLERATFKSDDKKYGIFIDYQVIQLKSSINVANISFGIFSDQFVNSDDLDTSITNFGKPRTILSTVAEACISNKEIINCDIICLAAADQLKNKRNLLYSIALSEIRSKVKKFKLANDITVTTQNGTIITLLSNYLFSEDDKKIISIELGINK